MYTRSNDVPPPDSGAAKTTLPVIAAIICGALILMLFAATIVLALIPIYLPKKTLTANTTSSSTGNITLYLNAGNARRKRANAAPSSVINGTVTDSTGISTVKTKILAVATQVSCIAGMNTPSISFAYGSSNRRRRHSSSRRSSVTQLIIIFALYYQPYCNSLTSQDNAASQVQALLKSSSAISGMSLPGFPVNYNGTSILVDVNCAGLIYLSDIHSGKHNYPQPTLRPTFFPTASSSSTSASNSASTSASTTVAATGGSLG
jgi:hypothetical protein